MDSVVIIILMLFVLSIKFIVIDRYAYDSLRIKHSKSYIKKHYRGLVNKLLYNSYKREISIVILAINYISILVFFFLLVLFILSLTHLFDLSFIINLVIYGFGAVILLAFIYDMIKLVFMNRDLKDQKTSPFTRILGFIILVFVIYYLVTNLDLQFFKDIFYKL